VRPYEYHYHEARYWRRRERPNRSHVIIWTDPQTRRRHTRSFPRKPMAMNFKREVEKHLNGPLQPAGDTSWLDLYSQFTDVHACSSRSHRQAIARTLDSFYMICRPKRLCDITPAICQHYFARFARGDVPARTNSLHEQRKDWKILHAFLALWVRRGLCVTNPLSSVAEPRPPQTLAKLPTDQDWIDLLAVVPKPDLGLSDPQAWHLLILLGVVTGIDRDNLLRVTLSSVSPDPTLLTLTLGSAETGGVGLIKARRRKTGRVALHGLPSLVCDRIAARINQLPDGKLFLFPWRTFQRKQFDRIRKAAHFRYPFKSLRAACATRVAEQAAIEHGRHQLGHASGRTTERHYLDMERVALATARQLTLPTLPRLPDYLPPAQRARLRRGRPGRPPVDSE